MNHQIELESGQYFHDKKILRLTLVGRVGIWMGDHRDV